MYNSTLTLAETANLYALVKRIRMVKVVAAALADTCSTTMNT